MSGERTVRCRPLTALLASCAAGLLLSVDVTSVAVAQTSRKPTRVQTPTFQAGQFEHVFFADPAGQLQGTLPATDAGANAAAPGYDATADEVPGNATASDPLGWKELISPTSLEDLVKGGKLRLDKLITTPTAFKGGGYVEARKEFSLQGLLFAIIETYPGEVRWQRSAAAARERFSRVAANAKVGSEQVYSEAKLRLLDLSDLVGGTPLADPSAAEKTEIVWENLIDRVPLMQLLEWAHEKNLSKLVASANEFRDSREAVLRYAELTAVLGRIALVDEMPDAADADYAGMARDMIAQARQVALAVKTEDAELARNAAAQLGQACTKCHESFR